MKKRINIIFFGICFLAALLGEVYCIEILKGDLFSIIGIGIVVLITGYLFMDSIISAVKQSADELRFFADRAIREEDDKWNQRFTDIVNLQKATYTATKKNTVLISEQIKEAMSLLEGFENNSIRELQKITELQKISMEGQKNALKMEIQYDRENTKKLINLINENENKSNMAGQLSKIINLLEVNNELIKSYISSGNMEHNHNFINNDAAAYSNEPGKDDIMSANDDKIAETAEAEHIAEVIEKSENSNEKSTEYAEPAKMKAAADEYTGVKNEISLAEGLIHEEEENVDSNEASAEVQNTGSELNTVSAAEVIEGMPSVDTAVNPESKVSVSEEKNASGNSETGNEESESETIENSNENETITPLYDDPNKALSADEIAALFASFGK